MALFSLAGENESQDSEQFIAGLHLGGDGGNTSGYSMYRIWLASLSSHCGWEIECETLRIPSTRNWALVGESSIMHCAQALDIDAQVEDMLRIATTMSALSCRASEREVPSRRGGQKGRLESISL